MKMKLLLKRKQWASTLLTTLFICSLLGLSTMGYLALVEYQNRLSSRSQSWNLAIALVEAGVEEGLQHLNTNWKNLNSENWVLVEPIDPFHPRVQLQRTLSTGTYTVTVDAADISYPSVECTATVNLAPLALGRASSFFAAMGMNGAHTLTVSRAVKVYCYKGGLFPDGIVTKDGFDMNGNNVTVDSFRSCDAGYGGFATAPRYSKGNVATNGKLISVGNANIYGHAATGHDGTVGVGNNGVIGDKDWLTAHPGQNVQPGYVTDSSNFTFPDTTAPENSGPAPGSGCVVLPHSITNSIVPTTTTTYPNPVPQSGVTTNTAYVSV